MIPEDDGWYDGRCSCGQIHAACTMGVGTIALVGVSLRLWPG